MLSCCRTMKRLVMSGLRLVKTQSKEPFDAGLVIDFEDRKAIDFSCDQ